MFLPAPVTGACETQVHDIVPFLQHFLFHRTAREVVLVLSFHGNEIALVDVDNELVLNAVLVHKKQLHYYVQPE